MLVSRYTIILYSIMFSKENTPRMALPKLKFSNYPPDFRIRYAPPRILNGHSFFYVHLFMEINILLLYYVHDSVLLPVALYININV